MKNILLPFLLLLFFACKNEKPPAEQPEPASAAIATDGWRLLFDGTSTDQWRSYGKETFPAKGWVVENSELIIKKAPTPRPAGFGGDIITKEKFGDFELRLDFLMSDTANSGIFYFVVEEEGSPIWFNAPEFQILDNQLYVSMGTVEANSSHLAGGNYDVHPAPTGLAKPAGEWNTARILHKGGHVEHWLNGQKTVEYQIASPAWEALVEKSKFKDYPGYGRAKQGHIGLQDHDFEVRFRNIAIRDL